MPIVTIRFRRNTSVQWTALDPILDPSEPGHETDTGKFKIGDGFSHWSELEYFNPGVAYGPGDDGAAMAAVQAHIASLTPHTVYDDGPSLLLLYQNAKV